MNRSMAIPAGYGVMELKRAYRKNMLTGILTACLFNLVIIGGLSVIIRSSVGSVEPVRTIVIDDIIKIGPPPGIDDPVIIKPAGIPERQEILTGPPVAVPEDKAPAEVNYATTEDIKNLIQSQPVVDIEQIGNHQIVLSDPEALLPQPDSFVPYEEAPMIIENVEPKYPRMAQMAGITDIIWVKVLVDRDGKVKDVKVVKSLGTNAGFEEAAIEAALATQWKPAISNGQPVAVWTTYRIIFKLRDR